MYASDLKSSDRWYQITHHKYKLITKVN